jgi:hypothetical protein
MVGLEQDFLEVLLRPVNVRIVVPVYSLVVKEAKVHTGGNLIYTLAPSRTTNCLIPFDFKILQKQDRLSTKMTSYS